MADSCRDWSDLPKTPLIRILDSLNGGVYHHLLRAVCPAWRSALPFSGVHPQPPFQVPQFRLLFDPDLSQNCSPPPEHDTIHEKIFLLLSSETPGDKWVVQVLETKPNTWSFFNPLTGRKLHFPPGVKIDRVNLLDHRIMELGRSLSLGWMNDVLLKKMDIPINPLRKLISLTSKAGSSVLMSLSDNANVRFWQPGLTSWEDSYLEGAFIGGDAIVIDGFGFAGIKDIVSYNERFYAVDDKGRLLMFDPSKWREHDTVVSSNLIERHEDVTNAMCLVVSEGSLYLVVKSKKGAGVNSYFLKDKCFQGAVNGVKVFVLEEKGGDARWVEVRSIGDRVFFIGWDSTFSFPSTILGLNMKDCIYFGGITGHSEEFDAEFGLGAGFYDLGSGHFVQFNHWVDHSVYTRLFWPPPRWIAPNANLDHEVDPYEWLHNLRMMTEMKKSVEKFKQKFPGVAWESWALSD